MTIHPHAIPPRFRPPRRRGMVGNWLDRWATRRFFEILIKRTNNFDRVRWLGEPTWQNVLDLWTIQETIAELRPDAIIETGTNRGGSSRFFGNLFDLMGSGRVLTIDVDRLFETLHSRVTFIQGSSTDEAVLRGVRAWLGPRPGRVMVILDSDHSRDHVRRELELYAPLVTPGSRLLCQDGLMDTLRAVNGDGKPGPLLAIREFLRDHPEWEADHERCERFVITHHPLGWLRRRGEEPSA